jgi:hypothetical protein
MQRSGSLLTKDAKLVNMLVEVVQTPDNVNQRVFVKSRPGLSTPVMTTNPGEARGCYYWIINGVGHFYSVVANMLYIDGMLQQFITTSTGSVGFTEFVSSTGTVSLIMVDGVKCYVCPDPGLGAPVTVDSTSAPNFPTPHVPMPIFLDGYLFLAKSNTEDIYNCVIDDPTSWTAGTFISAEMYPDTIVALSKNNNYIYAVGSNSIEYFYDAGTAAPDSPLARHESAVQQFGTVAPATVVQTEKEVILLGQTGNGGHTVWTIDGFKETEIGTPAIRSVLRAEGSALPNAVAYCIRVSGQKLYIVNLTTRTLVYSFDTKMWSFWNSGLDNSAAFIGKYGTDGPNGMAYIYNKTTGDVHTVSEDNHTDSGTGFTCEIVTPKYDFDTFNVKFASRFSLIGDIPTTSGTGNVLQVSWTDNDYVTWSTTRDLSFDYDFPCIAQLGRFRRRAFKISYSQPYLLRLEAFEIDINKGNQ